MPITVQGLASSRKTPGIFLAVLLGGTPTSAGDVPKKILVAGNKITSDLTGAAPAFTTTAGTQGNAAPVFLPSADDAASYFGRGSEVHRMALAAFRQYPDALVYGCSVAESAGARADGVLTFATSATAAFTVRLTVCGKVIDVAVASGDSVTTIATNCANAILDEPDLPVTAQFVLGVLTVTAKCIGPRGNDLTLRAQFVSSAGVETEITTGVVTSPGATTGQLSSVATVESTYFLDGGTTADDVTAALAALAATKYDRQAWAHRDATNLDLIAAQVDSMAGVTTQLRQQFLYGTRATYATAVTLATGRNDSRGQCVWHYNSPTPMEEAAAQVAAGRLIGDGIVGGTRPGEASRPSANLDGVMLSAVRAQPFVAEQPTSTEIENALNNGLTPLQPSSANPGFAEIVRSITTRSLDAGGSNNYSVIDTSTVTVCDYVADDLQQDLATTFASKNLAADSSDGSPPTAANVVTPSMVKARIAYKLGLYEEEGNTRDAAANMPLLAVVESGSSPGRVDCEIPVEPATPLHIIGGNVRQVA
jgi:phage tail sheath gpL-like